MAKAPRATKLKRGRDMCRISAWPWKMDWHALIPVRKNCDSSARPSAFVRANFISLQMEGTSSSPATPQMWWRWYLMMRDRPRSRSSAAERASTADIVTATTPYIVAAIDALTADRIIVGRSTFGLPPASSLGLLLLLPPPPGTDPSPSLAPLGPPPPPPPMGRVLPRRWL